MDTAGRASELSDNGVVLDEEAGWRGLAPGAVEAAYVVRRPELIRVLMSAGSTLAEAEDVVQDVFLRALRHFQTRQAPENLFAWLMTCAKHAVVDGFRSRRREVMPPPDQWAELERSISDRQAAGTQTLIEKERIRSVAEAIATLDEIERRCLLMRSRGAKFREMAAELGIPLRTAAHHTSAAIEKLQRRAGL